MPPGRLRCYPDDSAHGLDARASPWTPAKATERSMVCRARLAQGLQGSKTRDGPENLSRGVSVRSATLWCDQLLFCYNFQLIIMRTATVSKNSSPSKSHRFRRQAPLTPGPTGLPAPQAAGPRRHERPCESTHDSAGPGRRPATPVAGESLPGASS